MCNFTPITASFYQDIVELTIVRIFTCYNAKIDVMAVD